MLCWYLDQKRYTTFAHLIDLWDVSLFNSDLIADKVEDIVEAANSIPLKNALVQLYMKTGKYLQAATLLLNMRDPRTIDILLSHNLLSNFTEKLNDIVTLPYLGNIEDINEMPLGEVKTVFSRVIELLVENRRSIPIPKIVEELTGPLKVILFFFLDECMNLEPLMMAPHEDEMIELYIKYEKAGLLQFLKTKSNYDVDKAIELCMNDDDLYNELIYLWSRIGENRRALSLIIDKLDDPTLAFQFVKTSKDDELWDFLISYSLNRPKFIKAILDSPDIFGEEIATIVNQIPENLEIAGLKSSLQKITMANELSIGMKIGIFRIVDDETKQIAIKFLEIRRKGKSFGR